MFLKPPINPHCKEWAANFPRPCKQQLSCAAVKINFAELLFNLGNDMAEGDGFCNSLWFLFVSRQYTRNSISRWFWKKKAFMDTVYPTNATGLPRTILWSPANVGFPIIKKWIWLEDSRSELMQLEFAYISKPTKQTLSYIEIGTVHWAFKSGVYIYTANNMEHVPPRTFHNLDFCSP